MAVERVGIHDNFFHLGGDSLLAIRLCQRISSDLSVEAPVALLFQYPTVTALAPQIIRQMSLISVQGMMHGPISPTQQQLWLIERVVRGTSAYHLSLLVRLNSEANAEQVIRATQLLTDRHTTLRTRFYMNDYGRMNQQVGENKVNVERLALTQAELNDRVAQIISTPFDLSRNYPFRVALLTTGECQVLLLMFHHIAVDGWSLEILCQELVTLYQAGVTDKATMATTLPPLTIDYLDFTLWQQNLVERQSQWWQQQLAGLEPLNLPLDYPRPQRFDCRGKCHQFQLSSSLSNRLQQLVRHQQTTLYSVMLSAFALLLGRYSGQNDLAVGTPIANRTHPQLEPLVGLVASILVVRAVLDPQRSFRELLAQIHSTVTDMQNHQQIPFEQLVDQSIVERDPSRTPIFQVMFSVQHFAMPELLTDIGTVEPISLPDWAKTVKFDLSLGIDDGTNPLTGGIEYAVALFRADTIERLVDDYMQILEQVVTQPDIRLRDLTSSRS